MSIYSTWLTINRACNLACKWCYAKEMNSKSNMDVTVAKKLIDISIGMGVKNFKLIGGEPTIYPHFFELLNYLIGLDTSIVIVTNGIKLADLEFCYALKKFNYSKMHLGISIKGTTDEEYIENCGTKGFSLLTSAIENCDKIGLSYSLSYVLTQENINAIDDFAHNVVAIGIKKPIFMAYCNEVISEKYENVKNKIQLEMDYKFSQKYDLICDILKNKLRIHQTFPLCMCEPNMLAKMLEKGQVNTTCHVHKRNGLIFDTNGSILLCNHLAGYGIGKFGIDYHDLSSFESYWNSEYVINLYKKFTTMPSEKCQDCNLVSKCGGGCFVQWFTQHFSEYENYLNSLLDKH